MISFASQQANKKQEGERVRRRSKRKKCSIKAWSPALLALPRLPFILKR
jgi:hypothetical protein